jgi:hypothetical protein
MIFLCDRGCQERRRDDGRELQGGPFSTGYYSAMVRTKIRQR